MEIILHSGSAQSRRFADILTRGFRNIYPYPWLVTAEPACALAEVLRTSTPAVLLETAYHDNPDDADWIKGNIDNIARTIVLSLTEYFGVPFIGPQPERAGQVNTGGPNLLLRSRPNAGAPVLVRIPGSKKELLPAVFMAWNPG